MSKSKTKEDAAEEKTAVPATVSENKPLAVASTTVSLTAIKASSGKGTENIGMNDMSPPWFRILQALSAQVKKNKPEYVEGAAPGMFYNSATQEVYSGEEGVLLVPVHYETRFLEYTPKEQDKQAKFVADHGTSGDVTQGLKKVKFNWLTGEGNTITEVATYYALHYNSETGSYTRIIMSMPSSQAKKSRSWNSLIKNRKITLPDGTEETPAAYWAVYKAVVMLDSNGDNDWFTYKFTPWQDVLRIEGDGGVANIKNGTNVWKAAADFHDLITGGKITVQQPSEDDVQAGEGESASDAF